MLGFCFPSNTLVCLHLCMLYPGNKPITDGTTHDTSSETFDLCTLTVSGAYPSLTVVDVQGEDVANLHSKASLWNMLNVDK